MAAVVEQVPTIEVVLQVNLAQYLAPVFVPPDPEARTHAGRAVLDFDAECGREPDDRLVSARVIHPDDVASYFHTGGTTGTPKIARHTHANEVFMSWGVREFLGLAPGSVFLCGLPLFHVNGAIATGLGTFCGGATVLLAGTQGYRTPGLLGGFWRLIERYRVNYFSAVPGVRIAARGAVHRPDLSPREELTVGHIATTEDFLENLRDPEISENLIRRYKGETDFRAQINAEISEVIKELSGKEVDLLPPEDFNRTMGLLTGKSSYQRAAEKILQKETNLQIVVFGHTHNPVDGISVPLSDELAGKVFQLGFLDFQRRSGRSSQSG